MNVWGVHSVKKISNQRPLSIGYVRLRPFNNNISHMEPMPMTPSIVKNEIVGKYKQCRNTMRCCCTKDEKRISKVNKKNLYISRFSSVISKVNSQKKLNQSKEKVNNNSFYIKVFIKAKESQTPQNRSLVNLGTSPSSNCFLIKRYTKSITNLLKDKESHTTKSCLSKKNDNPFYNLMLNSRNSKKMPIKTSIINYISMANQHRKLSWNVEHVRNLFTIKVP